MEKIGYFKEVPSIEKRWYIKPVKGYYYVIDSYNQHQELFLSEEEAKEHIEFCKKAHSQK